MMGIAILCKAEPQDVHLIVLCDQAACAESARYVAKAPHGMIEAHAQMMRAGWLERFVDNGARRIFLCPEHSGKKGNADQA